MVVEVVAGGQEAGIGEGFDKIGDERGGRVDLLRERNLLPVTGDDLPTGGDAFGVGRGDGFGGGAAADVDRDEAAAVTDFTNVITVGAAV